MSPSSDLEIFMKIGSTWKSRGRPDLTPDFYYYPPPALPTYPVVDYSSLPGATPANFATTLAAVASDCYVRLDPDTDYQLGDFTQAAWAEGGYACYAPHVVGLICDGTTQADRRARIHMPANAMSSGTRAKIPLQGSGQTNNLWALRIGPNQSNNHVNNIFYGIEFVGHNQPNDPNTALPAAWNGLQLYYPGSATQMKWCKFTGFSMGTSNSPPGETNTFSTYAGDGMNLYGVESTGFNGDGYRSGGATSANGCANIYWENCRMHDSRVSGVTFSTAAGNSCGALHTKNLVVDNNANHSNAAGMGFAAINHEGVAGPILHENPFFNEPLDYNPGYGAGHVGLQNTVDNADCTITAPARFWSDLSESFAHNAFIFQIVHYYPSEPTLNKQTKMPTIVVAGVTLTPVNWQDSAGMAAINPNTQYCFVDAWI